MFVGQSIQSLDDKGRIVLKSKVRSQLTSTTVYLLFDLGHCLSIYSEDELFRKYEFILNQMISIQMKER